MDYELKELLSQINTALDLESECLKAGVELWEIRKGSDVELARDKFIVDDWGQFFHSNVEAGGYYSELPDPYAQLGEIIIGKKPGRESDDETILDHNYGLAIHDIALCQRLIKIAEEKNIGTVLTYMDTDKNIV